MATVHGTCRRCDTNTLVFDYCGKPGSTMVMGELLDQECTCALTPEEVEAESDRILESPQDYFGRVD